MVWCIPNLKELRQDGSVSPARDMKGRQRRGSILSPKSLNDCKAIHRANTELYKRLQLLTKANAPAAAQSPDQENLGTAEALRNTTMLEMAPDYSPTNLSPTTEASSSACTTPSSPASLRKSMFKSMSTKPSILRSLAMPEAAAWARDTASESYEEILEQMECGVYPSQISAAINQVEQAVGAGSILTVAGMRLSGEWATATSRLLRCAALFCHKEQVIFCSSSESIQVAAALLLLFQHDESKAFWTYMYMSCTVFALYWHDGKLGLDADVQVIDHLMSELGPDLSEHLETLKLSPGDLVKQYLANGFADASNVQVLKLLWDLTLTHGRHALVAAAIAVLLWAGTELLETSNPEHVLNRFSDAVTLCLKPADLAEAVAIWLEGALWL